MSVFEQTTKVVDRPLDRSAGAPTVSDTEWTVGKVVFDEDNGRWHGERGRNKTVGMLMGGAQQITDQTQRLQQTEHKHQGNGRISCAGFLTGDHACGQQAELVVRHQEHWTSRGSGWVIGLPLRLITKTSSDNSPPPAGSMETTM